MIRRAEPEETAAEIPSSQPLTPEGPPPGGSRELLTLALPLIVSQSFMTVQVFVDTVLLVLARPRGDGRVVPGRDVVLAAVRAARRSPPATPPRSSPSTPGPSGRTASGRRSGRASTSPSSAGLLFLLVVPLAPLLIAARRAHARPCRRSKSTYLRCLAFAALPMLVMAAVNGFFSGRGQTWTVLGIEAFGTAVNVALALVLIFGRLRLPRDGHRGGRLGDRGRVVGVGAAGRRAVAAAEATARSSPPRRAGGSSASCSAG